MQATSSVRAALAALAMVAMGCAAEDPEASCSRFVTEVVDVRWGPGQDWGRLEMPDVVYGPPQGGGCCQGSLDVVSLGNGGSITVGFGASVVVDGPGPDLVVFENAFESAGGEAFAELAGVEVSADGESFVGWPCTAVDPPYGACAGQAPVYLTADDGPIDPATSGGDAYDLADLGLAEARFVRITDREDLGGFDGVFDLDAVGLVNLECR
jgi:hypothetical protein